MKPSICKYCKKEFYKKHNKEAYCSNECRHEVRRIQNQNKSNRFYYKNKYNITDEKAQCIPCEDNKFLVLDYDGDQFVNYGHHHKNNAKCIHDRINNSEFVDEFKLNKAAPPLPAYGKYYYENQYGFNVVKKINGKLIYFGLYKTEEEAQNAVILLKQNNWNKECLA